MMCSVLWSCFTALVCLLNQENQVWALCTEENVHIEGGTYTLSHQLEAGSILTYQCTDGFYPYPDLVRVCSHSGRWKPAPRRSTCRQVECPNPAVIENGNVFPSEPRYFHQSQVTYECYEGCTLYGPPLRTCLSSGKWSGEHPVCQCDTGDHCPDPGVPPGGSRTGSLFDIGEKVTYRCTGRKMILIGSEERECQENGHWSGTEPTCYYPHTYDTPLEVSHAFGGEIKNTFALLETKTNVTQEGRTIKLTKNGTLNIYIALDVSMSISEKHFEEARNAVIMLIEKIAFFPVTPNYEVIFFASKPIEVINILSNKKPLDELVKKLKNHNVTSSDKAGTNLNKVFETFEEKIAVIQKREQANFTKHQHVIIIFTDGGYNMGGKPTQTLNRIKSTVLMDKPKEREEHLDIYIFGIGVQIYDKNLKSLTFGTGKRHYFRLQHITDLHTTFDDIINEEDIKGLCGLHRGYGKRKKYPWVTYVSVMTNEKTSSCLGSLVSPRFVLTAAHCFTVDHSIEKVTVQVTRGDHLEVKRIHKHPDYNIAAKSHKGVPEFYDYDVALIELKKAVDISASLRPICLPCTEQTNDALRQNYTCEQQEQFLIRNNERIHFLTKKTFLENFAHVKLGASRQSCIEKALHAPGITTKNVSEVVTSNFLCSGGTGREVDNIACKGDSGGAVFKNYDHRTIQVALVSWGNKLLDKCKHGGTVDSDETSRDFHFNLFKAVPFLKSILGKTGQDYAPIEFVD